MSKESSLQSVLEALCAEGGQAYDPCRFALVSALLRRARGQRPQVAALLEAKAERHLQALRRDWQRSRELSAAAPKSALANTPESSALSALLSELRRPPGGEHSPTLTAVEAALLQQEQAVVATSVAPLLQPAPKDTQNPPPLRALLLLQRRRAQQQKELQVAAALSSRPDSPGPLNPQMLAIKSLSLMQQLSPHYLRRFIAYVETLATLDRVAAPEPTKGIAKRASRKR